SSPERVPRGDSRFTVAGRDVNPWFTSSLASRVARGLRRGLDVAWGNTHRRFSMAQAIAHVPFEDERNEATLDAQPTPVAVTQAMGSRPEAGDFVRRFHLIVLEGAPPQTWESTGDSCTIGSHPSNDLVIDDPTVSRFHCEIKLDARGTRLRDLDSRNGTLLDGIPIVEGFLRGGSLIRLGRT